LFLEKIIAKNDFFFENNEKNDFSFNISEKIMGEGICSQALSLVWGLYPTPLIELVQPVTGLPGLPVLLIILCVAVYGFKQGVKRVRA